MAKLSTLVFCAALCTAMTIFMSCCSKGEAMELKSQAFRDGGRIPDQYVMPGAGGKNVSLPLEWSNPPEGVKSFAISIVDPHPVANNWVHWIVVNIPAGESSLAEAASGRKMPKGAVELKNSFGAIGYGGPQPPKGTGEHPYVVTVYALNVEKLDIPVSSNLKTFLGELKGKVIASAELTGMYGR